MRPPHIRHPPTPPSRLGGSARPPDGLAPEDRLLTLCCRDVVAASTAERVARLLTGALDWGYLVETSVRHAVAPLLRHGLAQIPAARASVPPHVGRELEDLAGRSAARHRRLYGVLGEIVAALRGAGVEVLALKDLDLAARLYPGPGLRPIGDLDLLVHRDRYEDAAACLGMMGFESPPAADVPYLLRYGDGHHLRRRRDEVWVDLQWSVAQREWDVAGEAMFSFDVEGLWRRAGSAELEGVEVLVPSLEDMLLHLCLHLEGHRYGELVLLCDIALLCERRGREIDWRRLCALAEDRGAGGSVARSLLMARRLLDAPVPAQVLERLAGPYVEAALHEPLFEGLIALHGSLDEIRLAADPPRRQMAAFERTVRRRRLVATQVCREVDGLVRSVCEAGAGPAIVQAVQPTAIVPDAVAATIGEIRLLVPPAGAAAARAALADRGYLAGAGGRHLLLLSVASQEPALSGAPIGIAVRATVRSSAGAVPPLPSARPSGNRAAALRALLHPRAPTASDAGVVTLTIAARPREAIVAHLAAELGAASEDRLFCADGLLHALEAWSGALDPAAVAAAARAGDAAAAGRGLALACALTAAAPELAATAQDLAGGHASERAFEWARYGASDQRDSALRRPFLFVFALLSAEGVRERARLLGGLVTARPGHRLLAVTLLGDVGRGLVDRLRPRRSSAGALAHWLEPDALMPAARAEAISPADRADERATHPHPL